MLVLLGLLPAVVATHAVAKGVDIYLTAMPDTKHCVATDKTAS
jgi:hypothetical protein